MACARPTPTAASATHTSVNINATITSALSGSPLDTLIRTTLVYKTSGLNSTKNLAAVSLLVFLVRTLRLRLRTEPYRTVPLIDKAYRFPSSACLRPPLGSTLSLYTRTNIYIISSAPLVVSGELASQLSHMRFFTGGPPGPGQRSSPSPDGSQSSLPPRAPLPPAPLRFDDPSGYESFDQHSTPSLGGGGGGGVYVTVLDLPHHSAEP